MALRLVKILASDEQKQLITEQVEEVGPIEFWVGGANKKNQRSYNALLSSDKVQTLTDKIQSKLHSDKDWRIIVTPVETVIPRPEEDESKEEENINARKLVSGSITREALYDKVLKGTEISADFIAFVVLSALVAAIGIMTDSIAVVIGAMVIAPLLGPNLALSFGITLGDKDLIAQSIKANSLGLGLTLLMAGIMGFSMPQEIYVESDEFLSRTQVGYEAIILAFAAGIAGVLSLTSGVSSAMVGVMVAVAMMPPAVVLGISLGAGLGPESYGAALLLAINIICVNISAKLIFAYKGIRPRTWYKQKKSKQSVRLSLGLWVILLIISCILIFIWQGRVGI